MGILMDARIEEIRAELERAALKYAMTGDLIDLDVVAAELLRMHTQAVELSDRICELSDARPTTSDRFLSPLNESSAA